MNITSEYIEREKTVSIIKADIRQCEEDAECAFGDEAYLQAVNSRENGLNYILREIEHQPVADVVEVVRCKDCKKYGIDRDKGGFCLRHQSPSMWTNGIDELKPNDFCGYGVRKEGAER